MCVDADVSYGACDITVSPVYDMFAVNDVLLG